MLDTRLASSVCDLSDSQSSTTFPSSTSEAHSESLFDCPFEELRTLKGRKSRRGPGRPTEKPMEKTKKKGEEMDKYWLRGFRAYMKGKYAFLRGNFASDEQAFWDLYLSIEGEPGQFARFHSYSRKYKEFLLSQKSFRQQFHLWFSQFGEDNLSKKYPCNPDMWNMFYRHAIEQYAINSPFGRDQSPMRTVERDDNPVDTMDIDQDDASEWEKYLAFP